MTYRHFYDKDASPIPGKAPIQMRVKGGPAPSTVQAGIDSVLNAFLANARISEASNLQKTVTLPDGTTVRMRSRFGQVIVDVAIPPQGEEVEDKEDFCGGIVIRPYCLTNEVEWLNAAPNTIEAVDFTLPEVTTKQRPAVPTLRPGDPTTHIVVQIRNNVPLDDNPVARGYVKIFRIKDPLVGVHAEVSHSATRYLVSANSDFSEFYLCGKKLTRVPPLVLPELTYTLARICAHGFVPHSFKTAEKTSGFLFVAVDKKLYGLDAGVAVPAWTLLATTVFDAPLTRANDFGDTRTTTVDSFGVQTITHSGSNGAGVLSTFTIVITPGTPRPSMSGTISLMHDGTVEAVQQYVSYAATLTIEGTNYTNSSMGAPANIVDHDVTRYDERIRGPGAMPLFPDRFLGGTFPRYTSVGRSDIENWACSGTFDGWVDVGSGVEQPDYSFGMTYERVTTSLGGVVVTTTNFSWDYAVTWPTASTVKTFSETYSPGFTKPASDVERYFYTNKDKHTGKLAWRRGIQRSCSFTPFPDQTGPLVGEILPDGFPSDPLEEYEPTGSSTTSYSEATVTYELLRPNGTQIISFASLTEMFGSIPFWAAAYDVVVDGTGGNKYANLASETTSTHQGYTICTGQHEIVQLSPLVLQTTPFHHINWTGPVGIHRATDPPLDLFYPAPYPGGASFSYSITFDDTSPQVYDIADYVAMFAPSMNDDPAWEEYPPGTEIRVGPGSGLQDPQPDSDLFCSPVDTGDYVRISYGNYALYDIRTHGFIAWTLLRTENTEGGLWTYNAVALIGNDVSVVPFRDVLDEWRNLSTPDPASDLKIMFYEAPAEVSLI